MDTKLNDLIETLEAIQTNNPNGEQLIDTLSIIANLMFELAEDRFRSPVYYREFIHDVLKIRVNFN